MQLPRPPAVFSGGLGELLGQDRPQPGLELGLGLAPEACQVFVGFPERLLHDVGRVQEPSQPIIDLQPSQQSQVIAILLERAGRTLHHLGFASPH